MLSNFICNHFIVTYRKAYICCRTDLNMNYTLRDRGYFDALKILAEEFDRREINYALVGGTGIQARISNILCRAQKTDIGNASGLEYLLRETKDFDITSNASEGVFVNYFNELQIVHPNVMIHPEGIRNKRMKVRGKEDVNIFINYQTGPQDLAGLDEYFYNECINTAENLNLRYGNTNFSVSVATPECLITSKLTRNDPKDIWDMGALMKTMKIYKQYSGKLRQGRIEKYLKMANKEEMIGRIGEIKKQILKE